MKRLFAAGLLTVMLLSGCGAEQQEQEEQTEQPEKVTEQTMTGTMDEIKDFMFVLKSEDGEYYSFDFEEAPEGLEDIETGDEITVTYTGEVSSVDAFTGTIVSVEPAE